jgi:hypothetical protein
VFTFAQSKMAGRIGWRLTIRDTAVGVVAPLPSVKTCGAVAGMPDSADTKERNGPGHADCPRRDVRVVGFLRGPS